MNRRTFLAGALLTWNAAAGARGIEAADEPMPPTGDVLVASLLPFAGTDRVRIEVVLPAAAPSPDLVLYGRIEVWPGGGNILWEGPLGESRGWRSGRTTVVREVKDLKPALWDLQNPNLYTLTVTAMRADTPVAGKTVRFGFRSFVTRNGQFFLNGRRLFLRGNAINPPGRGLAPGVLTDPAFADAYLRDLKSRNVNLVRIGADGAEVWLDACDALGMLVFQGRYGAPPGGRATAPPMDFDASLALYKAGYFAAHVRHPSVVINILSNEMPWRGALGDAFTRFFDRACRALRAWDPNRLLIANAGFGRGRSGDINDQHPYAGWYGGTFLGYLQYRAVTGRVQPITLSETVGAYTQPDGRFQIAGKQLAAALTWAGHSATPQRDGLAYQAFLAGQIIEMFRRLRVFNPRLAGVMPFTDIFTHWEGVTQFEQMGPKPVADQMRTSYQPVLLSWEMWTPHVYAGAILRPVAHIVNDDDGGSDVTGATLVVTLAVVGSDTAVYTRRFVLPSIPYYQTMSLPLALTLPAELPSGDYALHGRIEQGGKTISTNRTDLFIAAPLEPSPPSAFDLYDPSGNTAHALALLGVPTRRVNTFAALSPGHVLVIGEGAWDTAAAEQQDKLQAFVQAGGRVLLLRQDPRSLARSGAWLGAQARFAAATGMYINPERPNHPVFAGIPRERLRVWSDPSGWDERRPGTPAVAPVTLGFSLAAPGDLGRTAILADFGRGLASIALGEVFTGQGSVLICGFDLVSRAHLDPIADRLLHNLVVYTGTDAGHDARPLIDEPIVWGDYASERGLVGGPQFGLLVNVSGDSEDHSAGVGLSESVSVPAGRRPFGPFSYNGNCHIVEGNPASPIGTGVFFARFPAGRRQLLTTVRNPGKKPAQMSVAINGVAADTVTVKAGTTIICTTPLPDSTAEAAVRYTGAKTLVLVRTEFAP